MAEEKASDNQQAYYCAFVENGDEQFVIFDNADAMLDFALWLKQHHFPVDYGKVTMCKSADEAISVMNQDEKD